MSSFKLFKSIGLAIGTAALTLSVTSIASAAPAGHPAVSSAPASSHDQGNVSLGAGVTAANSELVRLEGNVPAAATSKNDRGIVDPGMRLNHMLVVLERSPEKETALRQLLQMQQNPGSPFYHQWLAPAEYGKTFGASERQIADVSAWLTSQGFKINEVRSNHLAIDISGTAGQIRQAFNTEIHELNVAGETHFGNMTNPEVPAAFAQLIAGVTGLNDIKATRAFSVGGNGNEFKSSDFYSTYNMTPVLNGSGNFATAFTGYGHVVAVAEDSIVNAESFDGFRSTQLGTYGTGSRALKSYDGVPASSCNAASRTGNIGEQQALADSEWALTGAPSAQVVLVACGDSLVKTGAEAAAEVVIDHPMLSGTHIDSLSVGVNVCQAGRSAADLMNWKNYLFAAAAEGVSVYTPSDYAGASACDLGLVAAPVAGAETKTPVTAAITIDSKKAVYCDADGIDGTFCNGSSQLNFSHGASLTAAARAGVQAVLNQVNGSAIGYPGYLPLAASSSGQADVSATASQSTKVKPYAPIINRDSNPIENANGVSIVWPTPAPVPYGTALSSVQLDAEALSTSYVPLFYNVYGIASPGTPTQGGGFDGGGVEYDDTYFGSNVNVGGIIYPLGPINQLNAFTGYQNGGVGLGATVVLPFPPAGTSYTSVTLVGAMVNNEANPTHTVYVNYPIAPLSIGYSQTFSDWAYPKGSFPNEYTAACSPDRIIANGTQSPCTSCMYVYTFPLLPGAVSVTLPNDRDIVFTAMGVQGAPIAGTFTYTPTTGTILGVGEQTLNTSFVPTNTALYNSATDSVTLDVFAAAPTITWPMPAPILYPTPLSSTQLDATATAVTGYTPLPLGIYVNAIGYFSDGYSPFNSAYGFSASPANDAYSANLLGSVVYYNGIGFPLGSPNVLSAVKNVVTIPVGVAGTSQNPDEQFTSLYVLAASANSTAATGSVVVTYGDGTTSTYSLTSSPWTSSKGETGETIVSTMAYGDTNNGGEYNAPVYIYGYTLALAAGETVASVTTPGNGIVVFGLALGTPTTATVTIPGTFNYTPGLGTVLPIGLNPLSTTFTPVNAADYLTGIGNTTILVEGQLTNTITLAATTSTGSSAAGVTTLTLKATMTPTTNGNYNGFVYFTDSTTGVLVATASVATNGTATITVTPTTTGVAAGLDTFVASYGGGTNYAPSGPSNTVTAYFAGILFTTDLTHDFSICYTNNGTGTPVGCGSVTTGSGDSGGTLDGSPTTCGGANTILGYNCTAAYGVLVYNFTAAAQALSLTFVNTSSGSFNYATNCPASLASGATCNYFYYYSPPFGDGSSTTVGKYESGSWKVNVPSGIGTGIGDKAFDRSGATNFPATLAGFALLNAGSLSVTPTGGPLNMGTLAAGATSAVTTLNVYNPNLTAVAYTITTPASPFIVTNTCKSPLAAESSCNIYVSLESSTANTYSGSVVLTPTGGNAITEAFTAKVVANTGLSLTTNTHAFGNVNDGSSLSFGLNITNKAAVAANVSISFGSGSGFTATSACPTSLAAGKSCSIAVTFAPTSPGASNYTVTLGSTNEVIYPGGSTGGAPYSDVLTFSGTGVASSGEFTATSTVKKWGNVPKGTSGGNYGVELNNSTASAITLGLGPINGSSEFTLVASSCTTTLAVNASCELIFGFNPTTSGAVTATYPITSGGVPLYSGGVVVSPEQISLSGTGQ
jgi:hypothetical protein